MQLLTFLVSLMSSGLSFSWDVPLSQSKLKCNCFTFSSAELLSTTKSFIIGKSNGSINTLALISALHASAPFPLSLTPHEPHWPAKHELLKLMSASYFLLISSNASSTFIPGYSSIS